MQIGIGIGIPFARGVGFNVASLFSNGEQGAWYDPSDVSLNWRRNLLTYTEQFDNAAWVKGRTILSATNTVIAPDGTTTAEKVVSDTSSTTTHRIYQTVSGAAVGTYTFSAFFQTAEVSSVALAITNTVETARHRVLFDLVALTTLTLNGTGSASIEDVGNGWVRCSVSGATISGDTGVAGFVYLTDVSGSVTYTGDGTSGIYIWGAQLEVGSEASSYQRIVTPEITYVDDVQPLPILYQDAAGTTPVTAVEQPVSLMLDKSKGLAIGEETIVNGDASAGSTGWAATNATLSTASGNFSITATANFGFFQQQPNVTGVKTWLLTFDVVSETGTNQGVVNVYNTAGTTNSTVSVLRFGVGSHRVYFTQDGLLTVQFRVVTSGQTVVFDNISVKEIAGNHAYTPSTASTSRPTLSARKNWLLATETLATQNVTTRAVPYVLSFWGTGTITLSGTSTAGPLVGTGADDRVYLEFTPTAGTLTLTVSGTVSKAQLEEANDGVS